MLAFTHLDSISKNYLELSDYCDACWRLKLKKYLIVAKNIKINRCHLHSPDEDVLLHHAEQPDDDGEDPVRGGGEARLPEHEEADGAGGGGGEPEVEQDQQLLHVLLGLNAEDEILLLDGRGL